MIVGFGSEITIYIYILVEVKFRSMSVFHGLAYGTCSVKKVWNPLSYLWVRKHVKQKRVIVKNTFNSTVTTVEHIICIHVFPMFSSYIACLIVLTCFNCMAIIFSSTCDHQLITEPEGGELYRMVYPLWACRRRDVMELRAEERHKTCFFFGWFVHDISWFVICYLFWFRPKFTHVSWFMIWSPDFSFLLKHPTPL